MRRAFFQPSLLLLLSLAGLTAAWGQEGDMDMANLQGIFSAAMDLFDSPNQPSSIPEFKKIIDALAGKPGLSPEASLLVKKSLEYHARASFNMGDDSTCDADLRRLISIDPAYQIKREDVSPKFFTLFDSLRGNLIGFLRVSSTPPGATVYLDDEVIGTTDLVDRPAVVGMHKLRLSRKGFEEIAQDVSVGPRQTLPLSFELARTAASLSVTTAPAGADVSLDGQPVGKTPEGPAETSLPLLIDGLALGKHIVTFARPCYETASYSVMIESIQDLELPTTTLDPSTAALSIISAVPGEAFIDGQTSLGKLPLTDATVCTGTHTIEVVFPAGKFSQTVSLSKGQNLSIQAIPRPTLLFLGVASDADLAASARERERSLSGALSAVSTVNITTMSATESQKLLRRAGLTPNSFLTQGKARSEQDKKLFAEALARVCAEAKVEMVGIGVLSRDRIQENLFLNFAAPPSASVESIYVTPGPNELGSIIARLNQPFSMYKSWIGCRTIDVGGIAGAVVLTVAPDGPAAAGRLSAGQVVVEAGGKPVASTAGLLQAVQALKPGDRLALKVRGFSKSSPVQPVDIAVGSSPNEIPVSTANMLTPRIIANLAISIKAADSGLARFLLAECFMRAGDYQGAYEELQRAQIGTTSGICDGTVAYYKGRVLLALGYKQEAAAAFKQALSFPRATVYDNDGRPVADLAQRYLRGLAP